MSQKEFCMILAEILGMSTRGIHARMQRGKINRIAIRRVNMRVVYVTAPWLNRNHGIKLPDDV